MTAADSASPAATAAYGGRTFGAALPPAEVSREVAALGGIEEAALGESPWWAGLRARLAGPWSCSARATPWRAGG